ncbi:MAG: D-glycero-beta-D-manno-heptose 1,7-bisphosphate 7-phosphatase [Gammaproteobacteria bacterium]|nr:MAG: D-glycero-beta-D-manno-heptose 1,7-bisphosphate 7-phosphatase [Gammaproteobacteria bacterium]
MKIIILDRDGVINQDSDNFIKSVDEFIPLPGSIEAITKLKHAGYKVFIATNQSGIARGFYTVETLHAMHDKLAVLLKEHDAEIDGIEFCPHGPDDNCDCRKPKTGMYLAIAKQAGLSDCSDIIVVGDSLRDLQAAQAVSAKSYLVRTGKGERTIKKGEGLEGIPVYNDLLDFVNQLLEGSVV